MFEFWIIANRGIYNDVSLSTPRYTLEKVCRLARPVNCRGHLNPSIPQLHTQRVWYCMWFKCHVDNWINCAPVRQISNNMMTKGAQLSGSRNFSMMASFSAHWENHFQKNILCPKRTFRSDFEILGFKMLYLFLAENCLPKLVRFSRRAEKYAVMYLNSTIDRSQTVGISRSQFW